MGFSVWSIKWKFRKLDWFTTHFESLVVNISTFLNKILAITPLPFTMTFLYFPWYITPFFHVILGGCFWKYFAGTTSSFFAIVVWITIWSSYPLAPGNFTLAIEIYMNRFPVALRLSTTSRSWPGAPIKWSMMTS